MKNFRIFHLKTFIFLVVNFSVHLNRLVMITKHSMHVHTQIYATKIWEQKQTRKHTSIQIANYIHEQINGNKYHLEFFFLQNYFYDTCIYNGGIIFQYIHN